MWRYHLLSDMNGCRINLSKLWYTTVRCRKSGQWLLRHCSSGTLSVPFSLSTRDVKWAVRTLARLDTWPLMISSSDSREGAQTKIGDSAASNNRKWVRCGACTTCSNGHGVWTLPGSQKEESRSSLETRAETSYRNLKRNYLQWIWLSWADECNVWEGVSPQQEDTVLLSIFKTRVVKTSCLRLPPVPVDQSTLLQDSSVGCIQLSKYCLALCGWHGP